MTVIELHDEVLEKAGCFLSSNKTPSKLDKLIIFALLHYLIKSYRLFKGVNLLCKNNLEQEAKILLRSLFEAYLLEEYIFDNPNDITKVEDSVIRAHIADKKQLDEMDSLGMHAETLVRAKKPKDERHKFEEERNQVIKIRNLNYEESIRRFRKRHLEWQSLTDSQIAKKMKLEIRDLVDILDKKYENKQGAAKNLVRKYYAAMVRDCAKSVHCNDLEDNVDRNDKGEWVLFLKSKETMRDVILLTSSNIFIRIMKIVNELLKFGKKKLIMDLDNKYKKCIQVKKDK